MRGHAAIAAVRPCGLEGVCPNDGMVVGFASVVKPRAMPTCATSARLRLPGATLRLELLKAGWGPYHNPQGITSAQHVPRMQPFLHTC